MYNKAFDLNVSAVTPFSANEGEQAVTGIMITGKTLIKDEKFLSDVFIGQDRSGLTPIINGSLPIIGAVDLKFSEKDDEMLNFPGIKERIPIKVTSISIDKPNSEGIMELKLKIKIPHASKKIAGEIVNSLRTDISIKIDSDQKELFE